MPDRQEQLVVFDQVTSPGRVDAGCVRDVIAVALQKADHRVLVGEHPVLPVRGAAGEERPVVGDLVGGLVGARVTRWAGHRAAVEAVPAVVVVGLPRRVRGLEQHVGVPAVRPNDERDVTGAAVVEPHQARHVNAGDSSGRDRPGRGLRPVAAVDEPARRVGQAGRLRLWIAGLRREAGDKAGPVALVVAQAVDVNAVGRGRAVHLEAHGGAQVGTDVGREALQGVVTRADDIPLRLGGAGELVFARDGVADRRIAGRRRDDHWAGRGGERQEPCSHSAGPARVTGPCGDAERRRCHPGRRRPGRAGGGRRCPGWRGGRPRRSGRSSPCPGVPGREVDGAVRVGWLDHVAVLAGHRVFVGERLRVASRRSRSGAVSRLRGGSWSVGRICTGGCGPGEE